MFLYRVLLTLVAPVLLVRLAREPKLAPERLGLGGAGHRGGRMIWLHAASNGELTSARGLIGQLLAQRPEARLIVTCNTTTGRALVKGWGLGRVSVVLAPLDYRWALRLFLRRWSPGALIVIENELWPNRLSLLAARGVPVLVVGARMSERSAARWRRLPGLVSTMLGTVSYLSAQDAGSRGRLIGLGLDPSRAGPVVDLKAAPATVGMPPRTGERLSALFPRASTVLAASTHEGEEEIILDAFARAFRNRPELRLILAPRHARRGPEVARRIAAAGLAFTTRSAGEDPGADTPVYLADTMGEMALWYALAGACFVGGSLVEKGGHTPYEPAAFGSAILHGPHVANFAGIYAALDAAGAARHVRGAADLCALFQTLGAEDQRAMADRATAVMADKQADAAGVAPLVDALIGHIDAASKKKERPDA
ncbi:Lipid IVA 3-deoxy-D-manno-octulosonic acid transferase [Rhodovulum sp. P5]|nr:Lipid IVA 3-deoxy-D-manno-octulosonic acid transferase [Rhodovulum sp. P5]